MNILPDSFQEVLDLVYNILNQGDSRYNDPHEENLLAQALLSNGVSLEKLKIPLIEEPSYEDLVVLRGVQAHEKYISKIMLLERGFKHSEIFFERSFRGSRPDVLAETEEGRVVIPVECCSCRVSKILDYLEEAREVWIITRGLPPWEKIPYLKEKMELFIFKRGKNWKKRTEEVKLNFKSSSNFLP